jgi:hypothetical protein
MFTDLKKKTNGTSPEAHVIYDTPIQYANENSGRWESRNKYTHTLATYGRVGQQQQQQLDEGCHRCIILKHETGQ